MSINFIYYNDYLILVRNIMDRKIMLRIGVVLLAISLLLTAVLVVTAEHPWTGDPPKGGQNNVDLEHPWIDHGKGPDDPPGKIDFKFSETGYAEK